MIKEYGSDMFDYHQCNIPTQPWFISEPMILLRSGRDAIRYVAKNLKSKEVWLPAYCCMSMVKPFLDEHVATHFYPVKPDKKENYNTIVETIPCGSAILYMSYFGHDMLDEEGLISLSQRYTMIEDKTQNLLDRDKSDFQPDFIVASIRKWIAVFDGGFVKTKDKIEHIQIDSEDSEYVSMRKKAFDIKALYFETGNAEEKHIYRELLWKAGQLLYSRDNIARISDLSLDIIYKQDYEEICKVRRENYCRLFEKLQDSSYITIPLEPNSIPLYFIIIVKDRADMQNKLSEKTIYCPHIWPLPQQAENMCSFSRYLSERLLCIHCDQRFTVEDMDYIAETIKSL